MNELALFAGAGGGILGGHLLGWRTVCAVERDAYAAGVLAQRQNDGTLEPFPIWSEITTFDGRPWRGRVDVISGGFPCQDISVAGKGAGIEGERSGLWAEMARVVREVRPRYVFVENSPALTGRGLGNVLGDLAALGYDCRWTCLSAAECGGVHLRDRIWIYGSNAREKRKQGGQAKQVFRFPRIPWDQDVGSIEDLRNRPDICDSLLMRNRNDVAFAVDRISAIGNGQVPIVAATAWEILSNETSREGG